MSESNLSQLEQISVVPGISTEDEWYDLLPVEKKLVLYTLSSGIVLLVVFVFMFGLFSK